MIPSLLRVSVLSWMALAYIGQLAPDGDARRLTTENERPGRVAAYLAGITTDDAEVFDKPDEQSYVVGNLSRGDSVRVRGALPEGWLAIEPQTATVCWIERSALAPGTDRQGHVVDTNHAGSGAGAVRAWVRAQGAVIRFGHPDARLPGPPRSKLAPGTMVRLVDRPPLRVGRGAATRVWYAIVPPEDEACYIRASAAHRSDPSPGPVTEIRTSYVALQTDQPTVVRPDDAPIPADVASELQSLAALESSVKKSRPIEQWEFGAVRSRYQALLKRAAGNAAAEAAVKAGLDGIVRMEQARAAAQKIGATLAQSHARDQEVSQVHQRLSAAARLHARSFNLVGFVQPSARLLDGQKLYALIGKNGSTLAYLDVPPGLDVDPFLSHRVGVRGVPHYSEELGARLIAVRDIENLGARP